MKLNLNHGEINKRIGKAIAKYRQESGFTQEQVTELLQIGNEAVSRMERGLIMPNVVRLLELAEIFQCTASDLLAEGSPRLFDKTHRIHLVISELAENDRQLMLHFLESFSSRLKQA